MQSDVRSIRDGLNGKQNSFGALRLVFAAAVIVSHAYPLSGRDGDPTWGWWNGQTHVGLIAVYGFLGISGYVVTKSAARLSFGRFAWHRVLRLYPAFWVALLVGAFVMSPIVWATAGRDMGAFWAEPNGPFNYVARNATLWIQQWDIHDLFAPKPLGVAPSSPWLAGAVNGSLWTLAYELICYILIGVIAAWGFLRRAQIVVPIIAGVFGLMQLGVRIRPNFFTTYVTVLDDSMITLGWVFMLGATAAIYSHKIPLRHSFGVAALVITLASLWIGVGFHVVGIPAFVYATIWLGAALPKILHRVGSKNDYSYGVYLYGWPVQQALAYVGLQEKLLPYVLLSLLGAGVLAWASWHGLEKWAMKAKDIDPWRARDKIRAPATA
ncbi:acyltransferase family protein [Microbacterium sp. Ag1]|uniref:acyltransferase family protein n=1 Tax=Microbacterium sp. Ag1 TaxID=1643443 RepID=UPI0006290DEB|nr:acyltransferase [Microbacterium sp. Ag1]KKX97748.1 hypothetical protein AAY78_11195 [Microbacterium sp. Ag1]